MQTFIYVGDKKITLQPEFAVEQLTNKQNAIVYYSLKKKDIIPLLDFFYQSILHEMFIIGKVTTMLPIFKRNLNYVKAAGGVVRNSKNETLLIYRKKRWDIPKGKLEKGEDWKTCAVREVCEETGLENATIHHKICNTYHLFFKNQKWNFKKTKWYKMKTSCIRLTPQTEEGIEQALWADTNLLEEKLLNTYPNILDVFTKI